VSDAIKVTDTYLDSLKARIQELENPWIPVEEDMPEVGEEVISTDGGCSYIDIWFGEEWDSLAEPTHWMHIPELTNE